MEDFDYLGQEKVYLDAACQSLRPWPVVEALEKYYFEHNWLVSELYVSLIFL